MNGTQRVTVCVLLIFIGTAAMMAPLIRYVTVGWLAKRQRHYGWSQCGGPLCVF
jgi:hypothetical protein